MTPNPDAFVRVKTTLVVDEDIPQNAGPDLGTASSLTAYFGNAPILGLYPPQN